MGNPKVQRVDLANSFDPRLVGLAAKKGTLYRYIPAVGSPDLLIKNDDGFSTDWISVGQVDPLPPITAVAAASVADVTVATAPANLDGIVLVAGDLVLLKDQAAPAQNGVYEFSAAAAPLVRAESWDEAQEFVPGRQVFVDGGTVNEDTTWINADYVTTLGVTAIDFIPSAAGANTSLSNLVAPVQPNQDIDLQNTQFIINSPDPVNPQDVATKAYVDASTPTGTAGRVAIFGGGGALTDDAGLTYDAATNAMTQGSDSGLAAAASGSMARGFVTLAAVIDVQVGGEGSFVSGYAQDATSRITASSQGSLVTGWVSDTGIVRATAAGNLVAGIAYTAGLLEATADGAAVLGSADGASSIIRASSIAAFASGMATNGGDILATAQGSFARGFASGAGSNIQAQSDGSMALGSVVGAGTMVVGGGSDGSFAGGYVNGGGSQIACVAIGSRAFGSAAAAGFFNATGQGSYSGGNANAAGMTVSGSGAFGHIHTTAGSTNVSGNGAVAFGSVTGASLASGGTGAIAGGRILSGDLFANGIASMSWGDDNENSADFGQAFGLGLNNSAYNSLMIGRYNLTVGTNAAAAVDTDPAFLIGLGASDVARADGFRVDQDGRLTTYSSQRHVSIRQTAAAADLLDERLDRTLLCDTSGNAIAVTLPLGEEGLEFFVKDSGNNAAANNITFVASGADVIEAGATIATNAGSRHFQFFGGTWWYIGI